MDPAYVPLLLGLFAFGIGKAALMPLHRWLPAAMVAPTPVSALLHAVAVVKAGVFSMLKISIYIFGVDFLATSASDWLVWVAAFSILAASIVALSKTNLKARLYSTISQRLYCSGCRACLAIGGLRRGFCTLQPTPPAKLRCFLRRSDLCRASPVATWTGWAGAPSLPGLCAGRAVDYRCAAGRCVVETHADGRAMQSDFLIIIFVLAVSSP